MKKLLWLLVALLFLCAPLAACQQKPSGESQPSETEPPAEPDLSLQEDELAVYFNGTTLQCVSAEGTVFTHATDQETEITLSDNASFDVSYTPTSAIAPMRQVLTDKGKMQECWRLIFGDRNKPILFTKTEEMLSNYCETIHLYFNVDHYAFLLLPDQIWIYDSNDLHTDMYSSESVDMSAFFQTYFPYYGVDLLAENTDEIEIGFDGERFWCKIPSEEPFFSCTIDEITSLGRSRGFASSIIYTSLKKQEKITDFLETLFANETSYRLTKQEKRSYPAMMSTVLFTISTEEPTPITPGSKTYSIGNHIGFVIRGETLVLRTLKAEYAVEMPGVKEVENRYFSVESAMEDWEGNKLPTTQTGE